MVDAARNVSSLRSFRVHDRDGLPRNISHLLVKVASPRVNSKVLCLVDMIVQRGHHDGRTVRVERRVHVPQHVVGPRGHEFKEGRPIFVDDGVLLCAVCSWWQRGSEH